MSSNPIQVDRIVELDLEAADYRATIAKLCTEIKNHRAAIDDLNHTIVMLGVERKSWQSQYAQEERRANSLSDLFQEAIKARDLWKLNAERQRSESLRIAKQLESLRASAQALSVCTHLLIETPLLAAVCWALDTFHRYAGHKFLDRVYQHEIARQHAKRT